MRGRASSLELASAWLATSDPGGYLRYTTQASAVIELRVTTQASDVHIVGLSRYFEPGNSPGDEAGWTRPKGRGEGTRRTAAVPGPGAAGEAFHEPPEFADDAAAFARAKQRDLLSKPAWTCTNSCKARWFEGRRRMEAARSNGRPRRQPRRSAHVTSSTPSTRRRSACSVAGGSVRVQMHAGWPARACLARERRARLQCYGRRPVTRVPWRALQCASLELAERIDFVCARLAPCRRLSSRCRLANAGRSPAAPRPTARCAPPCERERRRSAARVLCSRRAQSAHRRAARRAGSGRRRLSMRLSSGRARPRVLGARHQRRGRRAFAHSRVRAPRARTSS